MVKPASHKSLHLRSTRGGRTNPGVISMLLKDFIQLLQSKYDEATKDKDHFETMGEPVICVDVFEPLDEQRFQYIGYSQDIEVDLNPTNGDLIISAFAKIK